MAAPDLVQASYLPSLKQASPLRKKILTLVCVAMEIADTLPDSPEVTFKSPLDRWLWRHRRTARWLADECGVHEATISRIVNGKTKASADLAETIKRITGLKRL
jgi:hypothetical protein